MNQTETVHICLVSRQLQPNVIPWIELQPDRVLLLVSKEFNAEAEQLKKIAHDLQIKAAIYRHPIPAADYRILREYFLELATELAPDAAFCINLTGGTKLMALAAAEVLAGEGYQFIYTDTQNRQIEYLNLNRDTAALDPHLFNESMKITELMACGMARVINTGTSDDKRRQQLIEREDFTEQFTRVALKNRKAVGTLNWKIGDSVLSSDGRTLKSTTLHLDSELEHAFSKVLNVANSQNLIQFDAGSAILHFRTVEEARWLNGVWLEEYVWLQLRAAGLKQYDTSVELQWLLPENSSKAPANELDVIAAFDNKLWIIECKSGKLRSAEKQAVFHKLSQLSSQLAGPFGGAILASLHAPDANIASRATHSNVEIIHGQELLQLKSKFTEWMGKT